MTFLLNSSIRILSASSARASVQAALQWIRRSYEVTGCCGSAHSYRPFTGWMPAYPETSGYLVETLLDAADLPGEHNLRALAIRTLNWLCDVQLSNGAFTALTVEHRRPSVFNTAQVLLGFAAGLQDEALGTPEERSRWTVCAQNALEWLVKNRSPQGGWPGGAYQPGYDPTYYTRALWGMLRAAECFKNEQAREVVRVELQRYAERMQPDGSITHWGFWPHKPAHTHTIAYTLDGFWRCSALLQDELVLEKTLFAIDAFVAVRTQYGRTAGAYGENWRPDHRFRCVTGNAQMCLLLAEVSARLNRSDLRACAAGVMQEVFHSQCRLPYKNVYGAIPGSTPFYGPYLRFRFPNWAAKFWVDALLSLYREDWALTT